MRQEHDTLEHTKWNRQSVTSWGAKKIGVAIATWSPYY